MATEIINPEFENDEGQFPYSGYKNYIGAVIYSGQYNDQTKVPVTLSKFIYDSTLQKFQDEINAEISNPKTLTVFIFKKSVDSPKVPDKNTVTWDTTDNSIDGLSEGWYLTDDNIDDGTPVWMSYNIFDGTGNALQEWSTPIKASGEDGLGYTFVYKTNTTENEPEVNKDDAGNPIPDDTWLDHPSGISPTNITEWVLVKKDNENWIGPVLWAKWGANGKDGDGVEYIYCLSENENNIPNIVHDIDANAKAYIELKNLSDDINQLTDEQKQNYSDLYKQEREYIPSGSTGSVNSTTNEYYKWSDSPSGASRQAKYEFVAIRKFNHEEQKWSEFETPVLWSRGGDQGLSVWVAYNDSQTKPTIGPANNSIDLENGWYFADEVVLENNIPYITIGESKLISKPLWWCQKNSSSKSNGTWGPISQLNGTSMSIKGSKKTTDDLCSITDATIGDAYTVGDALYVYVNNTGDCEIDWTNLGTIKGPGQYIHIRYAEEECDENNICKKVFTNGIGLTSGRYLGVATNFDKDIAPDDVDEYIWTDTWLIAPTYDELDTNTIIVTISDDGTINPTHVIPYLYRRSKEGSVRVSGVPEGYTVYSRKNNGEWSEYKDIDLDNEDGVKVEYGDSIISFKLTKTVNGEEVLLDTIEIPVISNLINPLVFDLTNLMISIPCDAKGNILKDLVNENGDLKNNITTACKVYYGSEDVSENTIFSIPDTSDYTAIIENNILTISKIDSGKNSIVIPVTAEYTINTKTYERNASFIINKLIGLSAIYEISTDTSIIKFGTSELSCKIRKTDSQTSLLLDVQSGLDDNSNPVYYFDNNPKLLLFYLLESDSDFYEYSGPIELNNQKQSVSLILKLDGITIDTETIPIVFDGNTPEVPTTFVLSFVFCRSNSKPDAPKGGDYDDPKPSSSVLIDEKETGLNWSDSVPGGPGVVWMSQFIFNSKDDYSTDVTWSEPVDLSDTTKMETIYSAGYIKKEGGVAYKTDPDTSDIPTPERDPNNRLELTQEYKNKIGDIYWYDEPESVELWKETETENGTEFVSMGTTEPIWMAQNIYEAGAWQGWKITKIKGEDGRDGTSIHVASPRYDSFEEFVKGNQESTPTKPGWAEYSEENGELVVDTWYSPEHHNYSNDSSFIVGENLYVWDGDSWENVGKFTGAPGNSAYVHVLYANKATDEAIKNYTDDTVNCFVRSVYNKNTNDYVNTYLSLTSGNNSIRGKLPGLYIGLFSDFEEDAPTFGEDRFNELKWSKWEGEDGFGYEYVYCNSLIKPELPKNNLNIDDFSGFDDTFTGDDNNVYTVTWTDNPSNVDENNPYRWKVYRLKKMGTWSEWKGTSDGKPVLDGVYGSPGYTVHYINQNINLDCDSNGNILDDNNNAITSDESNTNQLVKYLDFYVTKGLEPINISNVKDNEDIDDDAFNFGRIEITLSDGNTVWGGRVTVTISKDTVSSIKSTNDIRGTAYLGSTTLYVPFQVCVNKLKPGPEGPGGKDLLQAIADRQNIRFDYCIDPNSGLYHLVTPTENLTINLYLREGDSDLVISKYKILYPNDLAQEQPDSELDSTKLKITIPKPSSDNNIISNLDYLKDFDIEVKLYKDNDKYGTTTISVRYGLQENVHFFSSTIFTRTNIDLSECTVTGGTYKEPIPTSTKNKNGESVNIEWFDTIPTGVDKIWMSHAVFNSLDSFEPTWSKPSNLYDTSDFEVMYSDWQDPKKTLTSPVKENNSADLTDEWKTEAMGKGWYDDPDDITPIWMATCSKKVSGDWGNWVYSKIQGENAIQYTIITDKDQLPIGDSSFKITGVQKSDGTNSTEIPYNEFAANNLSITVIRYGTIQSYIDPDSDGVCTVDNGTRGETIQIKLKLNDAFLSLKNLSIDSAEPNYSIEATPDTIYVNVDNNSKYVLETISPTITFKVLKGGVIQDLNNWTLSVTDLSDGYNISSTEPLISGTLATFDVVNIISGLEFDSVASYIDIFATCGDISISKRINIVGNPKGDDGNDGKDACQINIDKPVVTFITDETQGFILNDTSITACIQVYKGGTKHNISPYYLTINYKLGDNISSSSEDTIYDRSSSNGDCVVTRTVSDGNLYININISKNIGVSDIFEYIDISYTVKDLDINVNTKITSVFVPQGSRGEVGPMGETGPLMYPAGEWKAQAYNITNNTAPYVYYKDTEKYYVLKKDCLSSIEPTNTSYWTEITQYEAIWTKVLMANFANIASAVFWGNYMFSEQGVTEDGTQDTLQGNNYEYYAESMFDSNENLSGIFIPNLLIDFNKGYLKTNYLLDSYLTIPDMYDSGDYYHNDLVIDLNNYSIYNIKIQPRFWKQAGLFIGMDGNSLSSNASGLISSGLINYSTALVCMPTITENYKNGLTSKIIYEIPIEPKEGESLEPGPYYTGTEEFGVVILCADNFILNKDKNEGNGWFIKNGEKFKFILVSSGTILSLKLTIVEKSETEKLNYWYIENAEDFAPITTTIARWIQPDDVDVLNPSYEINFIATSEGSQSTYNIHSYSFLGSKSLSYVSQIGYNNKVEGNNNNNLDYNVDSSWGVQFEFDLMYHANDLGDDDFTKYGYKPGWYIHNKNCGDTLGIISSKEPIIRDYYNSSLPTWDEGDIYICRPAFIGLILILSDNSVYIGTSLYTKATVGSAYVPWTCLNPVTSVT